MTESELEDEEESNEPSPLERMALPFVVEDRLVEPFDSFIVVRLQFERTVSTRTIGVLERSLDEWLIRNRNAAHASKEEGPQGEVVQVGPQSVECQIHGPFGDPDAQLPFLLDRIAEVARHLQPVLLVELD